jgi:hypothetical protein
MRPGKQRRKGLSVKIGQKGWDEKNSPKMFYLKAVNTKTA